MYLDPGGSVLAWENLSIVRARTFAQSVFGGSLPFVTGVECRRIPAVLRGENHEMVVLDVEVERSQIRKHDVQRSERIGLIFAPADNWYPEVLALRRDFPRVPHLNCRDQELPRSLCLYDQPWAQIALRWTPAQCIDRLRQWLAETANGTLHQTDQPLEPMIRGGGTGILVLPSNLFENLPQEGHVQLGVSFATRADSRVLIATQGESAHALPFVALAFVAQPQTHGAIRQRPRTLADLDAFLAPAGIQLLDRLRVIFPNWNTKEFRKMNLMVIVGFPLMREGQQTVESQDMWAFLTMSTVEEVGIAIGVWEKSPGNLGLGVVIERRADADGRSILLDVFNPQIELTRAIAAAACSCKSDNRRVVGVGVGALGSQVIRLLAQSGFGQWTLIDEDVLLPHNLCRHASSASWVGHPKVEAMAVEIDMLYKESERTRFITADILRPNDKTKEVTGQFQASELVIDLAASIPVSRHLVHNVICPSRRISLFLNSRGTDLVVLAEDVRRVTTLDCLEMQYYRAVASRPELVSHLSPPEGRIRYARSCRDITSTIPNHLVALHAAIGASAVRNVISTDAALIRISMADVESMDVQHIDVPVTRVETHRAGNWTLIIDDYVTARLSELRQSKLPKETGGIFIGAYDLERRIMYVVDTIPSPADSKEWPTCYYRGCEGLRADVDRIHRCTDQQLEYLGEWHSHPNGCGCRPSRDDLLVFSWLSGNMSADGLPALMCIAGENGVTAWFLGEMLDTGGWEVQRQ